jgi:hypothetical protein
MYGQSADVTPLAFYQAKENKPEEIAAAVSRLFLGVRLECAQCHNHPFAKWRREDFWGLAAFFNSSGARPGLADGAPRITVPDLKQTVKARFIDGSIPQLKGRASYRQTLADWVTSPENSYFAKVTVNRLWAQFFGRGIVDPIDDFDENNPPSHPELLNELAREFARQKFDLRFIASAITATRVYQLTSRQTHPSQADPRLFARAPVRGLNGHQLYDSISTATGFRDSIDPAYAFVFRGNNSPRAEFLEKFKAAAEQTSDRQTSVVQALTLMNGRVLADATSLERSETLAAVVDFPLFTPADRVEALFLAALSRRPRPKELQHYLHYVESGGPRKDTRAALADVFWALLNSSEFAFNH